MNDNTNTGPLLFHDGRVGEPNMTADSEQSERIIKALHDAEFLASDLREAHAKSDNVAEEMMLMDLLSECHRIRDRLKRLSGVWGGVESQAKLA